MIVVKICCTIILILCLINYVIDFILFIWKRYCRYHIGRWEKRDWRDAVERRALRWLNHTPVVKITDNSRYILLDFILGKYRSNTIQSWQKAALILGLYESGKATYVSAARHTASMLLEAVGNWKRRPDKVDCGMLSYALLRTATDPETVKGAMDTTISVIMNSINDEGLISYTGDRNNPDMYVDTIGLCCPFLACYARVYKRAEYETIAFKQLYYYHQYGMLNMTVLPNHAFDINKKLPLGVYGWGRGVGWYVMGLLDTYEEMETKEYKDILRDWIIEAAEEYKKFQHADGGFGSIIQREQGYDSSATAVLSWFYLKCALLFACENYYDVAEKSLHKLMKSTRISGAIDWCQGDSKGIGIFSQTYDVMPFAQGMVLRAFALIEQHE